MEWIQTFINRFTEGFTWFYILQPWEQALRIRLGKKIVKYEGGLHFKIPYIDTLFKQNTRLRLSVVPVQTITTLDHKTVTTSGALSYRVQDIEPLYMALHMAEDTISRQTQGIISKYIAWHEYCECSPEQVMIHVNATLDLEKYGLADVQYLLKDYAVVRTYRFITGNMETWTDQSLQVNQQDSV